MSIDWGKMSWIERIVIISVAASVWLMLGYSVLFNKNTQKNEVKDLPKILSVDVTTKTVVLDYGDFTRVVYKDGECCDFGNENTKYENNMLGE